MQLLPVQQRKIQWTRGLQQMCRLLEHHEVEWLAKQALSIPLLVAGKVELNLKHLSKMIKVSHCSLPGCPRNDRASSQNFKRCKRCAVAKYCSKKHQREHWKVHKRECKKTPLKK